FGAVGSQETRENAEANRNSLRNALDQIPADLREKFLPVIEWAKRIAQRSDIIIDGAAKDSDRRMNEIIFLESQIKGLIQVSRATKNLDSIRSLQDARND